MKGERWKVNEELEKITVINDTVKLFQIILRGYFSHCIYTVAIAETPEEPIHSQSSDTEDGGIPQQSNDEEIQSPLITSIAPDEGKTDEHSVAMATAYQTVDITVVEAIPRLLDPYEEGEDALQK